MHKGNHAMNRTRLSFEASRKTSSNEFVGAAYGKNPGKIYLRPPLNSSGIHRCLFY